MDYTQHFNPNRTPQTGQADPRQVQNSAGGFSFALDKWKRLERFLVLGSEGGSYYASERELTLDNAKCIGECLDEDGPRAVRVIAELSESGRAPKNDPAVFALSLAAAHASEVTRAAALEALPRVCRIGTHLFQFTHAVNSFRGWGRGLKRALGQWYETKSPEQLAHQVLKYQSRSGWSHRDVLRLAHLEPTPERAAVYRWVVAGAEGLGERTVKRGDASVAYPAAGELPPLLAAYEELKGTAELARVCALIREHKLTHEMVPGQWKAKPEVWEALAEHMPLGALIRNLAKLTSVGVIAPLSGQAKAIAERLTNAEQLKRARVHPIAALSALMVYRQGHGEKGSLTWSPVPAIIDALDAAFYASFQNVEPTGKNILLALDVSGSMASGTVAGVPGLTPRVASAALAMVTMRTEANWHVLGFSHQLIPLPLTPRQRLDDVLRAISGLPFGSTDCALPMQWARQHKADVDAFVTLTDCETWHGAIHPHQALRAYRQERRPGAKSVVVGMVANSFSIADPEDAGQLDVVGFDSAGPAVIADFIRS